MAPKYRQIPTKTPESFDFNEMPTDFARLFWLMLPICLDREGRGVDSVQWLRSKLFPIREDDISELIAETLDWLEARKMIVRYQVDGRRYFYSVNFKKYQSGTDKEAPSYLPAPPEIPPTPEPVRSQSGVTPDEVRVNTIQCNADASASAASDPDLDGVSYRDLEIAFRDSTGIFPPIGSVKSMERWVKAFKELEGQRATPEEIVGTIEDMRDRSLNIAGPWSIINGLNIYRSKNNHPPPRKRIKYDPSGRPIEVE